MKLHMMLLCKGTFALVAPLSKGREAVSPSCIPAYIEFYNKSYNSK